MSINSKRDARTFAVKAHGGQLYGDQPYVVHLDAVADLLAPYGEEAQIIGYLHDVAEDTDVTLGQVEAKFGKFVADAVGILTDEEGDSRALRKIKTYQKMAQVRGQLSLALVVKTADRLANVKACHGNGRLDKLAMYQKEYMAFREAVYRPGLCEPLWKALDAGLSEQ